MTKKAVKGASLKSDHWFAWSLQRGGDFRDEQAAGNPHHCRFWSGVVLRRNRELAGTDNGKPSETGASGAAASVAAWPEPAPALGKTDEKKPTENGWFSKKWWWMVDHSGTFYSHSIMLASTRA